MVASIQQIQSSNATNLNKVGFSATPETAQQVSLETPKDEFVKKESHTITNCAITGALLELLYFSGQRALAHKDSFAGKRPGLALVLSVGGSAIAGGMIGYGIEYCKKLGNQLALSTGYSGKKD